MAKIKTRGFTPQGDSWDAGQVAMFCSDAIDSVGGDSGWNMLVADIRRRVLDSQALRCAAMTPAAARDAAEMASDMAQLMRINGLL